MAKPDFPPAAFTPTMLGYTGQGAFRYWCQTALPLVYDDSLSYYELLNKVVVYLNNVISDVSATETNVESLLTVYNQLQDYVNTYFRGIDIQEEINNKLDEMSSSGELTEIISPFIPDLVTSWLNEHVTPTTPIVDNTLTIAGAAADSKIVGDRFDETNDLIGKNKLQLINYNAYDFIDDFKKDERTYSNITWTYEDNSNTYYAVGTASAQSLYTLYSNNTKLPEGMIKGKKYRVKLDVTGIGTVVLQVYLYEASNTNIIFAGTSGTFTIPDTHSGGLLIRFKVLAGVTMDAHIKCNILTGLTNDEISNKINKPLIYNFDVGHYSSCDDVTNNGFTFVSSSGGVKTIPDFPFLSGWLFSAIIGERENSSGVFQIAMPYSTDDQKTHKLLFRTRTTGVWGSWISIGEQDENILTSIQKNDATRNGINYSWVNNRCYISGTATALSFTNIFSGANSLPDGVSAGNTLLCSINSNNTYLEIFWYDDDNNLTNLISTTTQASVTIPTNAKGLIIRLRVSKGTTLNEIVVPTLINVGAIGALIAGITNNPLRYNMPVLKHDSCDLALFNGIGFVSSSQGIKTIPDYPLTSGWLSCSLIGENQNSIGVIQFAYPYSPNSENIKFRVRRANTWTSWLEIGGSGGDTYQQTINVTQVLPSNTYNITTSPEIAQTTINVLQAVDTSNTDETTATDMTSAIMSELTNNGVCILGKGWYYVSGNIDMPTGSSLIGQGHETVIKLLDTVSGYCVKMTKNNTVKGITFKGNKTDITPSLNIGGKNGIYFIANADNSGSSLPAIEPSILTECWFYDFNGSAIYCYNTGGGTNDTITITNCEIERCGVGINLAFYTEYHKITNVITRRCYYGAINNGGNNVFTACTFQGDIAFIIDNASGQMRNNSHGSCVGCTFNHSGVYDYETNEGIAIQIIGANNGFIFTGCQIWYGKIIVSNSRGISFSDCLIGGGSPSITLSGNYPVFFFNNIFQSNPSIDNTIANTVFKDNYLSATGAEINI